MRIPVTDNAGASVQLDVDDKSDAAHLGLTSLLTSTSAFARFANETLDATGFQSAAFGGDFKTPKFAINKDLTLCVKGGVNATLQLLKKADDLAELGLPAAGSDLWLVFRIESTVTVGAAAALPAGFGVAGKDIAVRGVATYTRFSKGAGFPTLLQAVNTAISNFRIVRGAQDVTAQQADTICETDVSGKFVFDATYSYPLAINALTLVKAPLPLNKTIDVAPNVGLSLTGELTVTGEFRARSHRLSESTLRLGLYKKRQTSLAGTFDVAAGLSADSDGTDIVPTIFSALSKENVDAAGLPDDQKATLKQALDFSVDLGFTVALNLGCAAAHGDEAAVLYEVSTAANAIGQIDAALAGNWTELDSCAGVKKLKTLTTSTSDTKFTATVNLLGIYEYVSVSDFVKSCSILTDGETSTITITDKATAQHLATAVAPFVADRDALHKLLQESFLATAVYTAADPSVKLSVKQNLLIFKAHRGFADLKKDMQLGETLRLLSTQDVGAIALQKDFTFYRVTASAEYSSEQVMTLFFADAATGLGWTEDQIKRTGRTAFLSLLDKNNPVDAARMQALASDEVWEKMENQQFPSPVSRGDWFDIATWAHAVAAVAPKLKATMAARQSVVGDPSKNAAFMAARAALAQTLAEVTHNMRAAFEPGWPIAAMFALGGAKAAVTFEAQWDGATHFDKKSALVQHA